MPRPAETPGKPATERLTIRMNLDMAAWLDRARGDMGRAAFIRQLIRAEAGRRIS